MARQSWQNNTGVKITTRPALQKAMEATAALADVEVLVGFPDGTTDRKEDPTKKDGDQGITNAALGYIHDNGMPEQGIPARPFMTPGMESAMSDVAMNLGNALKAALRGNALQVEQQMIRAGMTAKLAIQNKINEGIPPPLSERTLQDRARRGRKGAAYELERRKKGKDPIAGMVLALPLIDTGQMRNAVNFVIRSKKQRG